MRNRAMRTQSAKANDERDRDWTYPFGNITAETRLEDL